MTDKPPMDEAALDAARQAMIERAAALPFFKLIGLEVVDLRPGWSLTKIAYRHDLCQPAQIMHGGIIATLIDTGIAYALLLSDAYLQVRAQLAGLGRPAREILAAGLGRRDLLRIDHPANGSADHPRRERRQERGRQRSRPRRFDLHGGLARSAARATNEAGERRPIKNGPPLAMRARMAGLTARITAALRLGATGLLPVC